jgi:hypothetical protein
MGKRAEQRAIKNRNTINLLGQRNLERNIFSPEALAAIERYPVLGSVPRSNQVLTIAQTLDALPEADRALALDRFVASDSDVVAALAEMPPMPNRPERLSADTQLASLIEVIESHSTPFDLAAYTAARLTPNAA